MNKGEVVGGLIGTALSATGTAIQTSDILQIISLVITILGGLITTSMAIVNWYKNAKKDGKIDEEEIKEGLDIVDKGIKDIKDNLDDKEKGDK